jgi:hypothetical protein
VTSADLRSELRAALDIVESQLAGRTIDLEMARLQVSVDPASFRAELAALVAAAVAATAASAAITVRVARRGGSARIDVVVDGDGTRADDVVGTITIPLAPGAANAPAHG